MHKTNELWFELLDEFRIRNSALQQQKSQSDQLRQKINRIAKNILGDTPFVEELSPDILQKYIDTFQNILEATQEIGVDLNKLSNTETSLDNELKSLLADLESLSHEEQCFTEFQQALEDWSIADTRLKINNLKVQFNQLRLLAELIDEQKTISEQYSVFLKDVDTHAELSQRLERLQTAKDVIEDQIAEQVDILSNIFSGSSNIPSFVDLHDHNNYEILLRKIVVNLDILKRIQAQLIGEAQYERERLDFCQKEVNDLQDKLNSEKQLQHKLSVAIADRDWFVELRKYLSEVDDVVDPIKLEEQLRKELAHLEHIQAVFETEEIEWKARRNFEG